MQERFTMTVAVNLILLDGNNILLLRRYNTGWANGYYAMPAGCLDGDESVTDAVIREAKEEANIIIKPSALSFGCVIHSYIPARRTFETIDFFFIARSWESSIVNNEPHKHDDVRFFPLNQLPQPMLPLAHAGLDNALKGIYFAQFGW